MKKMKDLRKSPIKTIVALGDSCTWGYSVSDKSECWVNRVTELIEGFQKQKIRLVNQGIGSNVLTPLCPAYEFSSKPSGMERLEKEVLVHKPDLLFVAYGLNDSRAGTPVEIFRMEYQKLLDMVHRECPETLVVLLNVYYMHECMYEDCENQHWNKGNYHVTEIYNKAIEQLAKDNGAILADIYSSMVGADWLVDPDHCHPSILGHQVIANKVFEAIVRNSSFAAAMLPKEPNIKHFAEKYGNGPDLPSSEEKTTDLIFEQRRDFMGKREEIEWSITYSYRATDEKTPRVLLIGDSICNQYQDQLRKELEGYVNVTFWASSKCLTHPNYFRELEYILDLGPYAMICFNNGLHSIYSEFSEWKENYKKAVTRIKEHFPEAVLAAVLTTPCADEERTASVRKLNAFVSVLAEEKGYPVIDLYAPMDVLDRKENWADVYHFQKNAIDIQVRTMKENILRALGLTEKSTELNHASSETGPCGKIE